MERGWQNHKSVFVTGNNSDWKALLMNNGMTVRNRSHAGAWEQE
jgi:hypothetical protein